MNKLKVLFELSPWFLIICGILGFIYALVLYKSSKRPWGKSVNYILFFLRGFSVFLISVLLIGPFLKYVSNYFERPIMVLAIDNSESIALVMDSSETVEVSKKIIDRASELDDIFDVVHTNINGESIDTEILFNAKETNIAELLREINIKYQGKNLTDVVLLSDGIYTTGISPTFNSYGFDIHTLAWGDTIPKRDVRIQRLRYNKVAYEGNKFPIVADIAGEELENYTVKVSLLKNKKEIEAKTVDLSEDGFEEIVFIAEASKSGLQRYEVMVQSLKNEFNKVNNTSTAIIDIIDGKENILILAEKPHPDVKAIQSVINTNQNYKVDIVIGDFIKPDTLESQYDLLILHGFIGETKTQIKSQLANWDEIPRWFINVNPFVFEDYNQNNSVLFVSGRAGQADLVTPVYNSAFSPFDLNDDLIEMMEELPPIKVPFGNYTPKGGSESLFFQRVGNIETGKPLMIFNAEGTKQAITMGDGIFRWKLYDYQQNKSNAHFNELILKTIQYLSARVDKRQFKVYPDQMSNLYGVSLEVESYNDLYERVYGNEVSIEISSESGPLRKTVFTTSKDNSVYRLQDLPSGIYSFKASTVLEGKTLNSTGEFVVKSTNLESVNLQADFNLMRRLSRNQNGFFQPAQNYQVLFDSLKNKNPVSKIHTTENFKSAINLELVFFFILALISFEWFIRKYSGGY